MFQYPVGVMIGGLRKPWPECLDIAADMGLDGVQIYCMTGILSPEENAAPEKRREMRRALTDRGLVLSAVCGDTGKHCGDPAWSDFIVEKTRALCHYAPEIGTNIIQAHIGVVPEDTSDPVFAVMCDTLGRISQYAAVTGCCYAVETGPEKAVVLKRLLDAVDSPALRVNLDPANLIMCVDDDPVQAVYTLKDYIVHTHAKDGLSGMVETPLGQGGVDFPVYLRALEEIGYRGFLTIEREAGSDSVGDIRRGAAYLRKLMAEK